MVMAPTRFGIAVAPRQRVWLRGSQQDGQQRQCSSGRDRMSGAPLGQELTLALFVETVIIGER